MSNAFYILLIAVMTGLLVAKHGPWSGLLTFFGEIALLVAFLTISEWALGKRRWMGPLGLVMLTVLYLIGGQKPIDERQWYQIAAYGLTIIVGLFLAWRRRQAEDEIYLHSMRRRVA